MGKFSYKKRKGNRKQSFKNRKRVKRGGENKEAAAPEAQEVKAQVTPEAPVTQEVKAQVTPVVETQPGSEAQEAEVTPVVETQPGSAAAEVVEEDWKEGASKEEVQAAETEVTNIEQKADSDGTLDPDEVNNLVKQLAEGKDVPLWAKALAKSGAAGTAAKILNKNPALRDALMKKGIKMVENANVSGASGAGAGAGASGASGAAGTGQYTADDAGYQKFMQEVKSNSELLKSVVYVNDQMSQIFLKQGTSWKEMTK